MLDAVHIPCWEHDVATGSSCSSLLDTSLLARPGTGRLLHWNSGTFDVHAVQHPTGFPSSRHARALPSAFEEAKAAEGDGDKESEEERREPGWPIMLISYYKSKIKEMQTVAREYALKKIIAERDSFRAHDAEEYANKEAEAARKQAEAVDNAPDDTIQQLQEKIVMQEPKEDAVKDEVVASTNLLDADDRRDQALKRQIEAMQKDLEYEQKLRAAMAEQKMRAERRNLIPGAQAVDDAGRRIVTKESCEREHNTVFRDGMCLVSGGENPPDSPVELKLANQETEDAKAIEAAELNVNKAKHAVKPQQHAAKQAKINLQSAEQEVTVAKGKLAKISEVPQDKRTPAEKKEFDADTADVKTKEAKVSKKQKELDDANSKLDAVMKNVQAAQGKDKALREKHIKDLGALETEQEKIEKYDVEQTGKAQHEIDEGKQIMGKAQADLAREEDVEAKVMKEEADALQEKADRAEGAEQKDLQNESNKARLWQREAEFERDASEHHNQKTVAAENVAQKNTFWAERRANKDAKRDAYANGEDDGEPDGDDPNYGEKKLKADIVAGEKKLMGHLTDEQAKDMKDVKKTMGEEKVAAAEELKGNLDVSDAQEERNSTALREGETQQKIQEEKDALAREKKIETSSLQVSLEGWPLTLQTKASRKGSAFVSFLSHIRSEGSHPLGIQGEALISCAPSAKQHFL